MSGLIDDTDRDSHHSPPSASGIAHDPSHGSSRTLLGSKSTSELEMGSLRITKTFSDTPDTDSSSASRSPHGLSGLPLRRSGSRGGLLASRKARSRLDTGVDGQRRPRTLGRSLSHSPMKDQRRPQRPSSMRRAKRSLANANTAPVSASGSRDLTLVAPQQDAASKRRVTASREHFRNGTTLSIGKKSVGSLDIGSNGDVFEFQPSLSRSENGSSILSSTALQQVHFLFSSGVTIINSQ